MKFIADRMLGKLAKLLRIRGFNVLYSNRIDFDELIRVAGEEKRIILTRNTLIKKIEGNYGYLFITDDDPKRQLKEIITNLDLDINTKGVFTRCIVCNYDLIKIKREDLVGRVPDYVFETHKDFSFCGKCDRIFWKGTHYENVLLKEI